MAPSSQYRRPLGVNSAHRQSMLRNLVTSLISQETISTTYARAKETQRMAEKLITLAKKNTNATRTKALSYFHNPHAPDRMEKLFGELRERYLTRPGGYTRVLLSEPLETDMGDSAILSLVDGPKDMRFAMTAKTLVRMREENLPMNEITAMNVRKVTRFRANGLADLENAADKMGKKMEKEQKKEEKAFEEKGIKWKWDNEIPRSDPRWRPARRRGPGEVVKRKFGKGEFDEEDPMVLRRSRFQNLRNPGQR